MLHVYDVGAGIAGRESGELGQNLRSGGSHLAEETRTLGCGSRRGSSRGGRRSSWCRSSRVLASGCWGGGCGLRSRHGRPGADGGGSSTLARHDY